MTRTTTQSMFETLETRNLMSATLMPLQPAILVDPAAVTMPLNAAPQQAAYGLTAHQKHRAEQLTSLFENSTPELRYGYIENIQDGRGYTAGRAGFCTATGDFYEVVKQYTAAKPTNVLATYLTRLKQLADSGSASTSGLNGIVADWGVAAQDADFRAVQDAVVDAYYYTPAMNRAQALGLTQALSKAQLYDAIIQHGEGEDHDGLPAMIDRATARSGGTPATGVSETTWLRNFLNVRIDTLNNATDPATAAGWRDAVSRVEVFVTLLDQGNMGLTGTLDVTVYGDHFTLLDDADSTPAAPVAPTAPVIPPAATGRISGSVFFDGNDDGKFNNWDNASPDRIVFIDANNNHVLDAGEVSTKSDSAGHYAFDGLAAGTYNVTLQSVSWFYGTTQMNQQTAVAAGGQATGVDFGEWGNW
jgi:chitosanase